MSLVLVKGKPRSWQTFVLTAIGLALLVLALVLAAEKRPGVLALSMAGGGLLAAGEIIVRVRRRSCRWVEDLDNGFAVFDQFGQREYRDEDVAALSFFQFERHSQGLLSGVRRHFVLWVAAEERPIEMINTFDVGESDPLAFLIDRISTGLHERANDGLASGRHIEGDRWRLDRWGLAERESADGGAPLELPLDQISGVDLIGRDLCVWRQGQESVALRVPIASRNAHLLYLLLDERVVETEAPPPQAPKEGLGRLLFEVGYKRRAAGMLACAIVTGAVAAWLASSGQDMLIWTAGVLAVLTVGVLALANFYRRATLRCYEFGMIQTGMIRDRELSYDQITTLTFAQERQFYRSEYTLFKNIYTGTNVSIRFEAAPDSGLRPISYAATLRQPDENIERLRNRVAERVADLMEAYFNQGQPIHWTTKITLRRDGIEYLPKKFIGRRGPVMIPYEFIGHYAVVETQLTIWHDVADDAIIEEPTSQNNFYPGLILFERLMARHTGSLVAPEDNDGEEEAEAMSGEMDEIA